MELNEFKLKEHVEHVTNWRKENQPNKPLSIFEMFGGSVGEQIAKMKMFYKLENGEHQFSDGKGEIVKRLTLVVDFNDVILQPHNDFAEIVCENLADALAWEVSGYFENCQSDEEGE